MGYLDSLMGRKEQVVFITRQHWLEMLIVGARDGIIFSTIAIATFLLWGVLDKNKLVFVLLLLLVFPFVHFVIRLLNWYNEQYIVTNRRVMQIKGVINKHVSDSSLEKVNDVVLDQSILGRMLGYGNLEIITGSDVGVNFFKRMAQPIRLKTEMLNQKEAMVETKAKPSKSGPTQDEIMDMIAELGDLHEKGILTDAEFEAKKTELLNRI